MGTMGSATTGRSGHFRVRRTPPEQQDRGARMEGTRHGAQCGKHPRSLSEVSGRGARRGVYPRGTEAQAPPNLRATIGAPLIITAENWKELKCPSACEQINKPWCVLSFPMRRKHVVSTGQSRDEAQVCSASERSQTRQLCEARCLSYDVLEKARPRGQETSLMTRCWAQGRR